MTIEELEEWRFTLKDTHNDLVIDELCDMARGGTWRTMESAPRDGTVILAILKDGQKQMVCLHSGAWLESYRHEDLYENQPKIWMPFPKLPEEA